MYINQFDKSKQGGMAGSIAETKFESLLLEKHLFFRRATLEEQYKHIDFVVLHPRTLKPNMVDVKSTKKVSRDEAITNSDILWVEIVNVQGYRGWLYGCSDYVALYNQSEQIFYIVSTKDLCNLCNNLCVNGYASGPYDALYKLYTREGRKDVISMIKFSDLSNIPYTKFN